MTQNPLTKVSAYRIGWWTHKWWPRWVHARALLTGVRVAPPDARPRRKRVARISRREAWGRIWRGFRLLRRPHRPWQAEVDYPEPLPHPRFCRRALTASGAQRKMARDWEAAQRGETTKAQRRLTARAERRSRRTA